MLTISRDFIAGVQAATAPEDLHRFIQSGITLELATIPPYLCAYYTLGDSNPDVAGIVRSVVIEEMLHMTIMCNLMNAIGGKPSLADPASVPRYPGKLPMNVGDSVEVRLRKCSIDQISSIFMAIEEPENPIVIEAAAVEDFDTIGQFYAALIGKLTELGDGAFVPNVDLQVLDHFPSDLLFAITDVASAAKAIEIIVVQGEGTSTNPMESPGDPAHYYRFQQVVKGHLLVPSPNPPGWSFSGAPITLDESQVLNMDDDPKAANYPEGSAARAAADRFNADYSALLRSLEAVFNGNPSGMGSAIGDMFGLSSTAADTLSVPSPLGSGTVTGLPFEYVAER